MSNISPTKKRKEPEPEEYRCGGCDRPEWNCYCRIVECECCSSMDHRYNMRSNMEINEDFYTLDMDEQLRNVMCMSCINNDSDEEDSDDWHDQQESDEEY